MPNEHRPDHRSRLTARFDAVMGRERGLGPVYRPERRRVERQLRELPPSDTSEATTTRRRKLRARLRQLNDYLQA